MDFEWNHKKAEINQQKYEISFQQAATVFGDPLAITFYDPDHSTDESRLLTFGNTIMGKSIVVSHTERAGVMRIISARRMTRQERKIYETG